MNVINTGVLKEPGEFTFYRNLTDDGWSSFSPAYVSLELNYADPIVERLIELGYSAFNS